MFGKIKNILNNEVILENNLNKTISGLMNCHIIFLEQNRKIVGEIIGINDTEIKVLLVGEIINENFTSGLIKKPSGLGEIRVINKKELELIIGSTDITKGSLLLGSSPIYSGFNISIPLNNIFAHHLAILGNTGSGKSCGMVRILQNLFISNPYKPVNSHFIIFDAYGEYNDTFNSLNEIGLKSKNYKYKENETFKFPVWFLDVADLAILLGVNDASVLPVLSKTLKLVKIFKSNDPAVIKNKNDIIAKCLMDILTSGKPSSTIRDQIIAVLSHYNTEELNLESSIYQPGYNRTFRQCLLIDDSGKINAILEVMKFLQNFNQVNLDEIKINEDIHFTLEELYNALDFALISEGSINNDLIYKEMNVLKTRLQSIINSDFKNVFDSDTFISKKEFIQNMFLSNNIVNIDLSEIDDAHAKIMTKLYSKLLFNYTTSLDKRGSESFNIILEEAHRYVQNDFDTNVIGYNIFDRITKEGRKYGTILTFITQRPSELSTTSLSQCANFIVFRLFHPNDLKIVKSMSTNVTEESLNQIKSLNPGTSFAFGSGFKIPILINFSLPNPIPKSSSVDIKSIWYD